MLLSDAGARGREPLAAMAAAWPRPRRGLNRVLVSQEYKAARGGVNRVKVRRHSVQQGK